MHTYSSKDPKLILAVPASLSHGASRIIFSEFACVSDNVVLLTTIGEEGTLTRSLFDLWNEQQRDEDKWGKGKLGRNVMLDQRLELKVRSILCSLWEAYGKLDTVLTNFIDSDKGSPQRDRT